MNIKEDQILRDDQSHKEDQTPKGTISPNWGRPFDASSGPTIPDVRTTCHLGFPIDIWGPSTHSYMKITCTPRPKTLSNNQISYIWKGDPEYLGAPLFTRKFPRIKGFRAALYHHINHKPYPSRGTQILLSSCILELLEILLSLT